MRIAGAKVLLTGATGGVGRALARQLTAAGAAVTVTGRRADALEILAAESGARPVPADLAVADQVARLAEECADTDVLIANAALPASGELLDYTPGQIDRALAVNLGAPIMLARLLAPHMVGLGRGHLAFVGSMSGKAATRYASLYTASKFGLRGFAHSLRQDLHGTGVGVSLVQPGFVGEAGMFADTGAVVPGGLRTVTPGEVAEAVIRSIEEDRCEINIAPLRLRLRCAVAGQFPGYAGSRRRGVGDERTAQEIVEAQRSSR